MKIIVDNQPRLYELTYMLSADATGAELTQVAEQVKTLIEKHQGEILVTEDWGKRTLSYQIKYKGKKLSEAVYTFLVVKLPTTEVQGLDRDLGLNESVMRHLLIVSQEQAKGKLGASPNYQKQTEEK